MTVHHHERVMMLKTVLTAAFFATTSFTVSACAKQDDAANTVVINETVPNDPAAADGNAATPDALGNDVAVANDSAALNVAGEVGNAQ
jgi:fructose-specific component phosphotransferase system IIB-like protein